MEFPGHPHIQKEVSGKDKNISLAERKRGTFLLTHTPILHIPLVPVFCLQGKKDNPRLTSNYEFYTNKRLSYPDGKCACPRVTLTVL